MKWRYRNVLLLLLLSLLLLISDQGEQPLSSQERWQKDIANVNVDWRKAYQLLRTHRAPH